MVADLVADELRGSGVSALGASFYERKTLLAVHDVHRFVFLGYLTSVSVVLAEEFEAAEVDALLETRWRCTWCALSFGDFSNASTRGVIYIPCCFVRSSISDDLLDGGLEL